MFSNNKFFMAVVVVMQCSNSVFTLIVIFKGENNCRVGISLVKLIQVWSRESNNFFKA